MKPEDAEEYTQALGQVVAGGYRMIAIAQRLGVPRALGLSTEDWVQKRLGGYVKYSIEERKPIVRELKAEGMTQREIAGVLGISQKTVDRDLEPESFDSAPSIVDAGKRAEPESSDSGETALAHFLGLSDNVTYVCEQLAAADVSEWHYRVFFRPETIVPDISHGG